MQNPSETTARTTADDYQEAGFGRHLTPGTSPILLLIDFARAYFDPRSPLYAGVETARASAARLHQAARAAHIPVIFTRVEYSPDGHEGGLFYKKIAALNCFERGNSLADFTPELTPEVGDEVVTKHYPSAFFGTGLAEHLHKRRVDTIVIAGLSTSGCVRATAVDALCHGFIPLVCTDAVGDRDPGIHQANLFDLAAKTAELLPEAGILAYFSGISTTRG